MTTSSALLTDIASVITTGPTTLSTAKSIAATGPINDLLGMLLLCQSKLKETKQLLTNIIAGLDASDGIKTTLTNMLNTFV